MKRLYGLAALLLAFSLSPATALADDPPQPEAIASARAEADRLIAQAGAADLFVNITDSAVPEVRHSRSGMECSFEPGARANRIFVYNAGGIPRGDDVSCTTMSTEVLHTLYATRYNPPIDTRQALTDAVAAIKQRWPDAKWFEGTGVTIQQDRTGKPPLPQTMLAHYVVSFEGVESYTQARVATVHGWMFKQRMTVPMSEIMAGQLLAEMNWNLLLTLLVDTGGTPI